MPALEPFDCDSCAQLGKEADFDMFGQPNRFDREFLQLLAQRGIKIETLDSTTWLGLFNEFLDQLRATGRVEDYRTELMADVASAGVAPLLSHVANKHTHTPKGRKPMTNGSPDPDIQAGLERDEDPFLHDLDLEGHHDASCPTQCVVMAAPDSPRTVDRGCL